MLRQGLQRLFLFSLVLQCILSDGMTKTTNFRSDFTYRENIKLASLQSNEGAEQLFGSMDLALNSAWIVDFCGKSSVNFSREFRRGFRIVPVLMFDLGS